MTLSSPTTQRTHGASDQDRVVRIAMDDALDGVSFRGMTFLNEAVGRYPSAISLAAGRPPDHLLQTARTPAWLQAYVDRAAGSPETVWTRLGQYADTAGITRDCFAEYLFRQEGVRIRPEDCVIANGFQEALLLELIAIARRGGAVVAMEPTYVGLMGAAAAAGVPLFTFGATPHPAERVQEAARAARADGARGVAFYVIPDFANPTGECLDEAARTALLEVAKSEDVLLLEDTAYRCFRYEGAKPRSLLSLDDDGRVVQLVSFSKTFLPGVRIGFSATRAEGLAARGRSDVVGLKSFTSVTTTPLAQAITAGFLFQEDFDIDAWVRPRVDYCRENRDRTLAALTREFGNSQEIQWSRPEGGFFIVVSLPFDFDEGELAVVARNFGVIVTPMTFFSPRGGARDLVRLSFSNTAPDAIDMGVQRFGEYVRMRTKAQP